jgi:branched-chain amino acid transport system substrate-binding protein
VKATAPLGGMKVGGDLTAVGTVDYSSYLIKAQAAKPDVIMFLLGGDDMLNALKQAVQFGLDKKVPLAGAQQELEPLEGLPPDARIGTWVTEWYWNQPGVPHVAEFVEATKKRSGRVPTARTWFGYVSVWTGALAAAKANSLKALDMAKALQDYHLPPEIALGPNPGHMLNV